MLLRTRGRAERGDPPRRRAPGWGGGDRGLAPGAPAAARPRVVPPVGEPLTPHAADK